MGKTSDSEMFDGSCVFIDSVTGFIDLVLQVNLNMHEMLNAIHEVEQVCRDHGVVPQLYHSDNASVFTSEGMAEKLKRFAQIITFAGAGAHHYNGMAERAIGTITNMARTMMLHAAIHWPEATNATQWLMAVMHAMYLYNHMPHLETGISPWIFSRKQDGSRRNFMIVMSGDAQCMCWTRHLAMERKSQSGSHDLSEPSTWGTHQSIQAQCHLS
jgi:hypothetical protein